MTVHRRTLPLVLALLAGPAGCISVEKTVPATPADVRPTVKAADRPGSGGFAALPSGPGEKIPTNPAAKADSAAATQTTSHRGNPDAYPQAPPPPETLPAARSEPVPLPAVPPRLPGEPEAFLPAPAEPPVLAALRAFAENHPDRGIDALKGLDKSNQEFVLAVLPALVRGSQLKLSAADPLDVAALVEQLQAAAARLEGRAALRVDKILFCKQIDGFGRYSPWPEGQPYRANGLAELYVEIGHLISEPTAKGDEYMTRLISSLEIRDANGRLVEQTDREDRRRTVLVAREERAVTSRSPLQDFHIVYRIPVPAQPGVYTVTVEIRSPGVSGRVVRSRPVEFRVAGP
jgi:hypothetical protein